VFSGFEKACSLGRRFRRVSGANDDYVGALGLNFIGAGAIRLNRLYVAASGYKIRNQGGSR
jgi:hypothetical protein